MPPLPPLNPALYAYRAIILWVPQWLFQCQANFLTYYCLSVIFPLRLKEEISLIFFIRLVHIKTFWLDVRCSGSSTGITITNEKYWT